MLKNGNGLIRNKMQKLLLTVVLPVSMLCACGKEPVETLPKEEIQPVQTTVETQPALRELVIDSIEEQGEVMLVATSFCELKYPFAFADLIQVQAVNEGDVASLEFSALISGVEHPLFAVRFGQAEGILLGTFAVPEEAVERNVYAEFYSADEAVLGEQIGTYRAAQEIFNDVVVSLAENQGLAAAE